ncbi:hypothetical protein OG866_11430 [Streptomyces sp. NBC_00663]|nr:hypothetical protein [Streptomyces sp. NBC_00663]
MILIALLIPVMLFLMVSALAALEDHMFPPPQSPQPEQAIPEEVLSD